MNPCRMGGGTARAHVAALPTRRGAKAGRILFTGSIAGLQPGAFQAVYNGSKAFIDSFSVALRQRTQGQQCDRHGSNSRRD